MVGFANWRLNQQRCSTFGRDVFLPTVELKRWISKAFKGIAADPKAVDVAIFAPTIHIPAAQEKSLHKQTTIGHLSYKGYNHATTQIMRN